ncbi:hypothetical protein ACEUAG_11560 [Aeromonas hydrophila]|uniref:hypothetical protein n=1 Tax=Aeromonas TaxID=642 RepID=UPI000F5400E5|nr:MULTISPECIES: hypothetical protein [Aeromonas]MCR3907554.1 hypothetical protein [Aeromonas hydrophila]RQM69738.1 hypothetical protein EHZ82_10130 [Aeromonas hydrophila]
MAGISDINISNYLSLLIDSVECTDIQSITGGASQANIIDVLQYNQEYAKKLVGSKSTDPFEITCSYVPSTASYKALDTLSKNNKAVEVKLTLKAGPGTTGVNSQVLTFTGIIASKSVTTEFDTARTVVYTLVVSGGITEAAGA